MTQTLMNKATAVLTMVAVLAAASCNNDEIMESKNIVEPDFEVSTMGQWLPATRGTNEEVASMPVLHFRDQAAYERTVEKLVNMSDEQRLSFYKTINFDGAYSQLNTIDKELDEIFDIEDSLLFETQVKAYLQKYESLYSFKNDDKDDITPHLKFNGLKNSLVANVNGLVVVGDNVVNLTETGEDSDEEEGDSLYIIPTFPGHLPGNPEHSPINLNPQNPTFRPLQDVVIQTKHSKYTSTLTMGYIEENRVYAAKTVTKKKKLIRKKTVKSHIYAHITIEGKNTHSNMEIDIVGKTKFGLLVPAFAVGNKNGYVNITISDFHSNLCPNSVSKTFNNVLAVQPF